MAKHKAPTQVTLVPVEEKSALAEFVEKYWKLGALLAVIITASILVVQYMNQKERAAVDESWNTLMAAIEETGAGFTGDPDELARLTAELKDTVAGPWGLFLTAQNLRADGRYEEALSTLSSIRTQYPQHPLVAEKHTYGESVTPLSLVEHLGRMYGAEKSWRDEHPRFFANPDLPAGAPKVRIRTDRGDIVVGLYAESAPLHVENFLKLAGEGFFDGTRFHQVRRGQYIAGGDPATKDTEPGLWPPGGTGADYDVEAEESGLSCFEGFLASVVKSPKVESNGSLFNLTVADAHQLDTRSTVFGKIIEGLEVAQEISELPTLERTGRTGQPEPTDIPQDPVSILSTEVLADS